MRSSQPLTEPMEFSFATTRRFGPPPSHVEPETPPSQKKMKLSETRSMGVTVPEPFNFATDYRPRKVRQSIESAGDFSSESSSQASATPSKRTSHIPAASPWVPLKQRMRELESATPEHWKKVSKPRSPVRPLMLTKPQEPMLSTAMRSHNRPSLIDEAEKARSTTHSFKAHPLNRKILESSGDLGVMRVVKRPLTQPQSPKLRVAQLASRKPTPAEIREREERELAQKRIFKALPVNGALPPESPATSARRAAAAASTHRPLTVAQSPMLHTKSRSVMQSSSSFGAPGATPSKRPLGSRFSSSQHHQSAEQEDRTFKARPMPDYSALARVGVAQHAPSHASRALTIPEPFALATDERSAMEEERRREREERARKEEAERRNFRARPLPNTSVPFRPHLELKITDPEPFALHSEVLHAQSQHDLEEKLEKERQERIAKAQFKARPVPQSKPLQVRPSNRPLTDVSAFQLNTENRSQARAQFETRKQQQEEMARMQEERRAALEAERQKQEIKRLRQQLVHKALPVPQSLAKAPAPVRASCQPLTEPKTPNFASTRRIRPIQ